MSVFPGWAGVRGLPVHEGAQTGRENVYLLGTEGAASVSVPSRREQPGIPEPDPTLCTGELWCHTRPRPPSCREGQRLSGTAPGVRKRAEPDPKPHVPIIRGRSLSYVPGLQPCSPEAVLQLVGGGWHPAALSGLGPSTGWEAEPVLLRGLAFSGQGAAKRFFQPDTPGTKAALRPEMPWA